MGCFSRGQQMNMQAFLFLHSCPKQDTPHSEHWLLFCFMSLIATVYLLLLSRVMPISQNSINIMSFYFSSPLFIYHDGKCHEVKERFTKSEKVFRQFHSNYFALKKGTLWSFSPLMAHGWLNIHSCLQSSVHWLTIGGGANVCKGTI